MGQKQRPKDAAWFRAPIDEIARVKEIEPTLREALYPRRPPKDGPQREPVKP